MAAAQLSLFDQPLPAHCLSQRGQPKFNGSDYLPARDDARLTGQYERIFALMSDGHWRTLREIAEATGAPEASVSAQLRHAKKARFGGHTVEKEHVGNGLFKYRLTVRGK